MCCRVPKGGVFKGWGNWGTLRIPREDWGSLGKIREPPPLGTPPPPNNPINVDLKKRQSNKISGLALKILFVVPQSPLVQL